MQNWNSFLQKTDLFAGEKSSIFMSLNHGVEKTSWAECMVKCCVSPFKYLRSYLAVTVVFSHRRKNKYFLKNSYWLNTAICYVTGQ